MSPWQTSLVAATTVVCIGCEASPRDATDANKALVRQYIAEVDAAGGSLAFMDKWLAPDFQVYLNSRTSMSLADFRPVVAELVAAFSDMDHDIHYMVAEDDRVAVGMTLQMTHTGGYQGVPASGRRIAIEEIAVYEVRDGRIAREWALVDFATFQQQLRGEAPAAAPDR